MSAVGHGDDARTASEPLGRIDRLRLAALGGVLAVTERIARPIRELAPRRRVPPLDWRSGVSVVIPERGSPDMVAEGLRSVALAAEPMSELVETIVVVNGSSLRPYDAVAREYPRVRWVCSRAPLGFATAVQWGVRAARHGGVYLLNSDMTLDRDALVRVVEWRRPYVFAVSSQIFFADPSRRREETGWADLRVTGDTIEMFHADLDDDQNVRGHLYAGGGASLFHRETLERFTAGRDPYHPFYFEDAEWGVRSWRAGYEVLFCPRSIAWHRHRGTVTRYFRSDEIDRVVERNRTQFQLRNYPESISRAAAVERVTHADPRTRRELSSFGNILALALARLRLALEPCADADLGLVRSKYYPASPSTAPSGPRVLVVSPYVVAPPRHGGAVRIHQLLENLSRTHRIVLLSDERNAYSPASIPWFAGLEAVHLVGGRVERARERNRRIPRIRNHSHPALSTELGRILSVYDPDLVEVEYMELGGLVADGKRNRPWVLSLHDVTLSDGPPSADDRFEIDLIRRHDAVVTCSAEDAALLRDPRADVVPNGAASVRPYVRSAGNRAVLFLGPFRYSANLLGIRRFLRTVYPELRRRVPSVELWIAGGSGAREIAQQHPELGQPGVRVLEDFGDPAPLLDACALTINPQHEIRGSSIKLIESLAAGRVCVSTVDGARGFRDAGFPGLVKVTNVEAFLEPLAWLLSNAPARLELEEPKAAILGPHAWRASATRLTEVYRRCLETRRAS